MTNQQTNKNYNNCDIRCGMLMSVRVNCNYITYSYAEQQEGGELEYIGKEGLEEKQLENFWSNYNMKATNTIEKCGINMEELIYLFEEHIEDWKDIFEWRMEEEEESEEEEEEEEEEKPICECKCNKCDKTLDEDEGHELEEEREDCEECGDIGIECIWNKEAGLMLCEECFDYYIVHKEIIKDLDMKEKMEN